MNQQPAFPTAVLAALLWLAEPAAACSSGELFEQIAGRLSHMPAVAAWKQARGLPVEDLAREQLVLDNSVARGHELGLAEREVRTFMQAQITAAKALQRRRAEPGDELSSIRRELLALGEAQLHTLACLRDSGWTAGAGDRESFENALGNTGLSAAELEELFAGLP